MLQFRILLVSVILLGGCFLLFNRELVLGSTLAEARTVAVNVFVLVELSYLFNCRSFSRSMFVIGLCSNPWVIAGSAAMVGLQLLFTYLPAMNRIFHSAPITGDAWLRIIAVAIAGYLVVGAEKWLTRKRAGIRAPR
jgi:cation-transporting P-type ATPase F